ncbi:TIGR02530 family flagellar biosynthesis protein [Actinomycetes bacterium NPDC127524]
MEKPVFRPVTQNPIVFPSNGAGVRKKAQTGFADHLEQAAKGKDKLTLSKHAQLRLSQRNIQIDQSLWGKIETSVKEARKKGVTESLVLTKDAALVVSAKNNTVITAMDRDEASSQIFTNINGTIILDR